MNVVIYAGDNKYYKTLLPIALELRKRGIQFLFMFSEETQLKFPHQKEYFFVDGDYDGSKSVGVSETLGINLPFHPDALIIARERWQPEQSIIREFKEKFNSKVFCVEINSHILNSIETRLEMFSRMQYPQNLVDYFFEHSSCAKERRIECMDETYRDKCIVVGNPRFSDINRITNDVSRKYNIDDSKKKIMFWGVINTARNETLNALSLLREKTKNTHQIFYKPYPGEPYEAKFKHQFNPFIVDGVQVIYDENDAFDISNACEMHICQTSSVFNFAFFFNKTIVNLDSINGIHEKMNDISVYLNESNNGVEDSAKFWMNIWNLKTHEEFKQLIGMERIQKFIKTNDHIAEVIKNNTIPFDMDFNFLKTDTKPGSDLIKLFDDFLFDGKAPERIVDFMEQTLR